MLGLKLNEDHDIQLENGKFVRNYGPERVSKEVECALRLFFGEFFLNQSKGVPWLQEILVNPPDLNNVESILIAKTLEVPSVSKITGIETSFDSGTRRLQVSIRGSSIYGSDFQLTIPEIL